MVLPSHCFRLKEGKSLRSFPFASGRRKCEGKSKSFLAPWAPAPSWSAKDGIGDSSGLFIFLTEPCLCRDCANLEKARGKLQQCFGSLEQGASCLCQESTKQLKEVSAQAEKMEQHNKMEVGFKKESGFPLKTPISLSFRVKDLAALKGEHPLLQSELEVKRQTLEDSQLQGDLLEQQKNNITTALGRVWTSYSWAALVGEGVVPARSAQMLFPAVEDRDTAVHNWLKRAHTFISQGYACSFT